MNIYDVVVNKKIPTRKNEVLACYFAYHGDSERYDKVRDPGNSTDTERFCLTRGIQFNLSFAYWCLENLSESYGICRRAVSEKLIRNNDLSFIHKDIYCIWYPEVPTEKTCRKLFLHDSTCKYIIGRVCAISNYFELYKELNMVPEVNILQTAFWNNSKEIIKIIKNDKRDIILNISWHDRPQQENKCIRRIGKRMKPLVYKMKFDGKVFDPLDKLSLSRRREKFIPSCLSKKDLDWMYVSRYPDIDERRLDENFEISDMGYDYGDPGSDPLFTDNVNDDQFMAKINKMKQRRERITF